VAFVTVSRVINGHPSVTPKTRAKVQKAIDDLGYRTNVAARMLAGGRANIIGVLSGETDYYGMSHTLFGVEAAAQEAGHMVNLVTVGRGGTDDTLQAGFERLSDAGVAGVVVIALVDNAMRTVDAIPSQVPVVVAMPNGTASSTVSIDQVQGARLATAHLLDLGHRSVHHVRGPRGWLVADARVEGWRQELRSRKLSVPRALTGDWSAASGHAAGRVLAADPKVTAVVAANDWMALGLMLALQQAGRTVPDDVSVVGFDDDPQSAFYGPPLTTVRQDYREVGRRSVDLLTDVLAGGEEQRITIEPSLVIRSSTAPPT
jgi:DNA-binding LacI/PurR family transcriptional regulator